MPNTDLWLRQLAARQTSDKATTNQARTTIAAVRELWEEIQRCAAVFNFHSGSKRHIKIFQRSDDTADVVFARNTAHLAYRKGQLQLKLTTINAFAAQELSHLHFQPHINSLGLLYWENNHSQKLSTDMLIRYVFEQLLANQSREER